MVKIAKKKMQTFPLNKLFAGRGQHPLDSLFANRPPSGSRQKRGIKAIEDQPARSNQQRRIRQSQEPIPQDQTVADPSTIRLQFAPDPDLKGPLIGFNAMLFQYLYHTFQVTKQILSCRATIIEQQINSDLVPLSHILDSKLADYIRLACKSATNGDKFIGLRQEGPSFQTIQKFYPVDSSAAHDNPRQFLWQLVIWRISAFGHPNFIESLNDLPLDVNDALKRFGDYEARTRGPIRGLSVYGLFQTHYQQRREILANLLAALPKWQETLQSPQILRTCSFAQAIKLIVSAKIPSITGEKGLVVWLIACDLSQYGFCQPPQASDLLARIGR
ncbi:MAG: hypothetical protein M1837_002722, partial [Sclerophora amabilis]